MKDVKPPIEDKGIFSLSCDLSNFDKENEPYSVDNYCLIYKQYQIQMIYDQYINSVKKQYRDNPKLLKLFQNELTTWSDYEQSVSLSVEGISSGASGNGRELAINYHLLELKKQIIHNIWFIWLGQLAPEPKFLD